jgi:iron complex outermembrane receptor protein
MKAKLWMALLPAVCLLWPASPVLSQPVPCVKENPAATGRIAGVVKDQTGAVVPGVKIEALHSASGNKRSTVTDSTGRFALDGVAVGRYQLTAIATAFQIAIIQDHSVTACGEVTANIVLRIAPTKAQIEVTEPGLETSATTHEINDSDRAQSRNAAELVGSAPGVTLRENGALASVPLLHGLGDERTKLVVDGMTVSSSCPNHMNPPLSTVAPSQAVVVTVIAGITPVSQGGDSIGGTITVDSREPVFAKPGERLREEGDSSGFYRSNGENYGGSLLEWVAGNTLGLGYNGSWTTNSNYTDGSGHKVTSSYAQSIDHTLTLAALGAGNLVVLQAGLHHTPYEGFVSAQMDLVRNYAGSINLRYRRTLDRGALDSRVYWQSANHSMNIGRDKSTFPMPMWMPMNTHGMDQGYSVKLELPLSTRHILRMGNELHRFVLDDNWPAVPGTAPMMGPNTFISMNDGRRMRLGWFGEVASKWNPQWATLFGLRNDTVWTNAGPVQGYSVMMYGADAAAFNALNHAKTDVNLDATGTARYKPNAASSFEFGYARKTRSPNLYERYAWSTNMMASGMIGWFGDGNYYVGNVGLKPERANTVSGTVSWHGSTSKTWEIQATPYLTYIQSYIDVDTLATVMYGMSTFAQLQFTNHNTRIYGADLSGNAAFWNSSGFGRGRISGVAGWLHGERLDTKTGLYQMMPVNARVTFDEELKGFTAGLGVQAVDRKKNIDPHRYEQVTPGYALFNLHAGYQRGYFQANAAADNLLNKWYELPLGGVNFDDYMASGWMSQIKPLTGRGRSVSFSLTARF